MEETLRYDPSVPVWRRVTTRPVTLAGVELPAGARLFLWLAAAGRDAAAFSQPDAFDLARPDAGRHLAFGKGLHYCLGANLGSWKPRSRSPRSPAAIPACGLYRASGSPSTRTSRSADRRP